MYVASDLFEKADQIDSKMDYRVEPNKVRTKTIMKLYGVTYDDLKKTI